MYLSKLNRHFFLKENAEAVVQRYSVKKSVLRNFAKFTGKHLCQSLANTSGRLLLNIAIASQTVKCVLEDKAKKSNLMESALQTHI